MCKYFHFQMFTISDRYNESSSIDITEQTAGLKRVIPASQFHELARRPGCGEALQKVCYHLACE